MISSSFRDSEVSGVRGMWVRRRQKPSQGPGPAQSAGPDRGLPLALGRPPRAASHTPGRATRSRGQASSLWLAAWWVPTSVF